MAGNAVQRTYVVRESEGQLQLLGHGLGVGSALSGDTESSRPCSESRPGETERQHYAIGSRETCSIELMTCRTLRVESCVDYSGCLIDVLGLFRDG